MAAGWPCRQRLLAAALDNGAAEKPSGVLGQELQHIPSGSVQSY